MFSKNSKKRACISPWEVFDFIDLLLLRLNRGNTLDVSLNEIKELNFQASLKEFLPYVFRNEPLSIEMFDDLLEDSTFYILCLEILRRVSNASPYLIADALSLLRREFEHYCYMKGYGNGSNILTDNGLSVTLANKSDSVLYRLNFG